jgi:hypothetical protein
MDRLMDFCIQPVSEEVRSIMQMHVAPPPPQLHLNLLRPRVLLLWSNGLTFRVHRSIKSQCSLTGYAYDPDCMYINGSGRDYYEFYIQLNRCGTLGKNSLHEDSRKNPTVSLRVLAFLELRNTSLTFFISLSRKTSCGTQ